MITSWKKLCVERFLFFLWLSVVVVLVFSGEAAVNVLASNPGEELLVSPELCGLAQSLWQGHSDGLR